MENANPAEATAQGWTPLSTILGVSHPFLEKTLCWEGYEISSNVYAVAGDFLTIIDPGNDYVAFMELFRLGYKPSDIRNVLLSHGHVDHAIGVFELFQYPAFAGKMDVQIITHEAGPEGLRETLKEVLEKTPRSISLLEVKGGETLEIGGFEVEVIHTPGHTMDSLCFFNASSRAVFTGDTVLPYALASPDPTAGGRAEYHLFTLKRLMSMKIDHLLPGHGLPVPWEARKVMEGSYTAVVKRMIGLETSWLEGATILAKKGYFEESLFCCERELEINTESRKALEMKAISLNDLGRFAESIDVFDEALKRTDRPSFCLFGKGLALMELEKYDESLKHFDEALKHQPDFSEALLYKGVALYLSGRVDEAMQVKDFERQFTARFRDFLEKKAAACGSVERSATVGPYSSQDSTPGGATSGNKTLDDPTKA